MTREIKKHDLLNFVLRSLYFCGTRIQNLRGPQLRKVINDYYMPFIRSGWTVPLSFVLDISAMLLMGGVTYASRWTQASLPPELKLLFQDYFRMLRKMRGNPVFQRVAELVRSAANDQRRDATICVFLRFLLSELSHFPQIMPFASRQLVFHSLRPQEQSIDGISITTAQGTIQNKSFKFHSSDKALSEPMIGIVAQLLRTLTDYYWEHPLEEFISKEEMFMIDYAARSDSSLQRVDYHLLHRMLSGPEVAEPEVWPPMSTIVEEMTPTDSYQQDGRIGGYVDINLKKMSENMSEVLPSEFALADHPEVMFHKMLNEGALHYIREDIERVEPELRVLFYFVIDTGRLMLQAPPKVHPRYPAGITPWVLGKSLFADMLRDLARYFPRKNVLAEVVWYLWSPEGTPGFRCAMNLFDWSPEQCANRYQSAARLADFAPAFFCDHLLQDEPGQCLRLDADPWKNFEVMCNDRTYHCRHVVMFTSPSTCRKFLSTADLKVSGDEYSRDSLWTILSDPSRPAVPFAQPATLSDSWMHAGMGMLAQERLRDRFLQTVLLKASARRHVQMAADIGDTE